MGNTADRRWIWVVLFVTVFPVIAIHLSCIAILGPGSWGSGVETKIPTVHTIRDRVDLIAYSEEWKTIRDSIKNKKNEPLAWVNDVTDIQISDAVAADRIEATGQVMVLTESGENAGINQKLYLSDKRNPPTRQIDVPREIILQQPTFLVKNEEVLIIVGRWNSWAISPVNKLKRYWESWWDPTLRPEYWLYEYDRTAKVFKALVPGGGLRVSPDRSMAIIVRSGAAGTTLNSLHIWKPTSDEIQTIASLSEADPGRGHSFNYGWSADSKAVFVWGVAGGFQARTHEARTLRWIYLVEEQKIFSIESIS